MGFGDKRLPLSASTGGMEGLKYVSGDASELDISFGGVELDKLDGFVKLDLQVRSFFGEPGEAGKFLKGVGSEADKVEGKVAGESGVGEAVWHVV